MKEYVKHEIKYLTQKEILSLFNSIENSNNSHSTRDLSIFRLAYRCGFRASEISLLKIKDYNMSSGEIYCKLLKGSNNNILRLDEKTKTVLDKYINENNLFSDEQIIFTSQKNNPISRQTLDYLIKKYSLIAGIKDKSKHHFHVLKHTTGVHLAQCNMNIKELQWWLGHKSISNTEIYFEFNNKSQDILYEKLSKKSELV